MLLLPHQRKLLWVELDAATVLQPEPDVTVQSRKAMAQETPKSAYISQITRQDRTYPESVDLTYKEEVAGLIGHCPLRKSSVLQVQREV
jgi:hypothetical protein